MAKIIRFPSEHKNVVEGIERLLEEAKNGNIKRFVFAAELNEQENGFNLVATSRANADVGMQQYLLAHLQADVTAAIVEVNFFDE